MLKFGDLKRPNSLILAFSTDIVIMHYYFLPLFIKTDLSATNAIICLLVAIK